MIFHLLFTPPKLPFKANRCWLKAIFYHTVKRGVEGEGSLGLFTQPWASQMAQVHAVFGNLTIPEPTYALCSTGVSHCAYGIAPTGAVPHLCSGNQKHPSFWSFPVPNPVPSCQTGIWGQQRQVVSTLPSLCSVSVIF